MDINNQFVYAATAKKEESYFCSTCKGKVILKKGKIKLAHFAHVSNMTCHAFSEGETEEHLKGKMDLYHLLQDQGSSVELEAYLPELKQRPDLLVSINGVKTAIEFQCSPLSVQIIRLRTEGYVSNGYDVIWVVGKKIHMRNSLTAAHRAYLHLTQTDQLVLYEYDSDSHRFRILSGFHNRLTGKLSYKSESSATLPFLKGPSTVETNQIYFMEEKRSSHEALHKEKERVRLFSLSRQESSRLFFEQLYLERETIDSIPLPIFGHVPHDWLIQTYPYAWKYKMWKWLEVKPDSFVLTKHNLKRQLDIWLNEKSLIFYSIPTIQSFYQLKPFIEFAHRLTIGGYLQEIGECKWKKSDGK